MFSVKYLLLKHSQTYGLEIMSNLTRICSCGYLLHRKGRMFSLGWNTLFGVGKLFCWSYIPDQLNSIFPVGFVSGWLRTNIHRMNSYFIYSIETKKSTTWRRKKMNFIILMQTQQEHNILLTVLPLSWYRGFTSELHINDTSFFNSFLLSASNS